MTSLEIKQGARILQTQVVQEQRQAVVRRNRWFYLALFVVALAAPLAVSPVFLMKLLCFALFACAFNLLLGYAGLLSFGHAAFLASGGYITGYLLSHYSGLGTLLGILAGTFASAALGLLFGLLAIRRQGIYFAMITLALAQLVFFIYVQAPFNGGEIGLHGVPRGQLFGLFDLNNNMTMYYFVLAVFVFGYAVIQRTIHSP
jgi:branched-chain amino acid transport system permease protein